MKAHILLVEDDTTLRETLARTLQRANYEVTQAEDGDTAITLLTQMDVASSGYDLVLTDIVMGVTDGVEVTNIARSHPDAPEVILLTGHGSLETAMAAIRAGAFDYLLKPCRTAYVLERVAAAIEHRQSRLRQIRDAQMLHAVSGFLKHLQNETPFEHVSEETTTPDLKLDPKEAPSHNRYRTVGKLRIDTYRHEVWFAEHRLHATRTEYMILNCLTDTTGRVVTYSTIMNHIRGYTISETEAHGLLRAHIRNLRKKLDRRYLVSVPGVGYMLADPDTLIGDVDEV